MCLVSTIITTHDRPDLFKKALESVLSQEFDSIEILVVDDSCDKNRDLNRKVCELFKVNYIENHKHQGSSSSLNIGVEAAKGIFIAILDDDDEWTDSHKIQKQVKIFEENKSAVLVGTNGKFVDYDDGSILKTQSNFNYSPEDIRENVLTSNPIIHSSVMYRKEAWEKVGGYDPSLARGKDLDLWLKLGLEGELYLVPDVAVLYRVQNDKQQNLNHLKYLDTRAKIKIIHRYRKHYKLKVYRYINEYIRLVIFFFLRFIKK